MVCPNCPRKTPNWPEWGAVSFPDADSGKLRAQSRLHAVQSPGPIDQPSPEHPVQPQQLHGASSGSLDPAPWVQIHQQSVAQAGAQSQSAGEERAVYQPALFRDYLLHFYYSPSNKWHLVVEFGPVPASGQFAASDHVLGPFVHYCH